jgi:hypothetical protein
MKAHVRVQEVIAAPASHSGIAGAITRLTTADARAGLVRSASAVQRTWSASVGQGVRPQRPRRVGLARSRSTLETSRDRLACGPALFLLAMPTVIDQLEVAEMI